ncbi:ATP-grasp fold amidoligase family protein [Aerococcus urinaeequi]|uniref:ATP-grasp fold amidoligase family protein n=1 Tax=Aerococcus urinaeequi TaxID=51665 RepID=UPI003AADCF0F
MGSRQLSQILKHPEEILYFLFNRKVFNKISDEKYLKFKFRVLMGENLNLKNPKTFNQKLQWLKLYDRKPIYTKLVNKYEAREIISDTIGREYLVPILGVYNNPSEIDYENLPQKFVVKPTHTSGDVYICTDKDLLDISKLESEIGKWMERDYYLIHREWPYKDSKRLIIIEQYLEDSEGSLKDYKLMCFNGKVEMTLVVSDRDKGINKKMDFFDNNWVKLPIKRVYSNSEQEIPKPKNFEKMIELAEKLAKNIPFVRVDFYEVNNQLIFGEMTFYPGAGFEKFFPKNADQILGDLLMLPMHSEDYR